jgi:hypothetical protein
VTLRFATNQPQELRLRFLEGKEVESQFGGMQHMFTCEEGAFYVSDTVGGILAEQIKRLGIRAGEPVEICKREVSNGNGRKGIQWQVERVGAPMGEQTNGTFVVPSDLEQKLAASIDAARKPPVQAQAAVERPKTKLEDALRTVVAAVFSAQEYARSIGFSSMPQFTSEDIRTMANTLMIQSEGGKRNAA